MHASFNFSHLQTVSNRGCHGFSKGRDFACEVGCGLFRLGVAHRGKRKYILRVRKLLHAKYSALEVKNERVEAFVCESFYLLLLFFICSLVCICCSRASFLVVFASLGPSTAQSYFQVTTFFIYSFSMHKSSKWASHHLHTTSSLIGSLFCSTVQTSPVKTSP